jgi:hypothetical protein
MNERDIEIMGIADDLLNEQNKLIAQQSHLIELMIEFVETITNYRNGGKP